MPASALLMSALSLLPSLPQGHLTTVSLRADGMATGDGESTKPCISGDGRYVAFQSMATNLVADDQDGNDVSDIFLRDLLLGVTKRVSVTPTGDAPNGLSENAYISRNGNWLVFDSTATDLTSVADTNGFHDVYRVNLAASTWEAELISSDTTGGPANNASVQPTISEDGSVIAFASTASDLVTGITDTRSDWDIFLFDLSSGQRTHITTAVNSIQAADHRSGDHVMSADGQRIAFWSYATDLVSTPVVPSGSQHIYFFDRNAVPPVRLVSVAHDGQAANGPSLIPDISPNGRFVLFASEANDLVESDANASRDAFVRDLDWNATHLLSSSMGAGGRGAVSNDGRLVAFYSSVADILPPGTDLNDANDVLIHRRGIAGPERTRALSLSCTGDTGNDDSTFDGDGIFFSDDERFFVFQSEATDLCGAAEDANGPQNDVFVKFLTKVLRR